MADVFKFPESKKDKVEAVRAAMVEMLTENGVDPDKARLAVDAFEKPISVMGELPAFSIYLNDLYLFSDIPKDQFDAFKVKFDERCQQATKSFHEEIYRLIGDFFCSCLWIAFDLVGKT